MAAGIGSYKSVPPRLLPHSEGTAALHNDHGALFVLVAKVQAQSPAFSQVLEYSQ